MWYLVLGVALMSAASSWMARGHWDAGEIAGIKAETEREKAEALAEADARKQFAEDIAARLENRLANLRIVNRTINNEVRHETEKVVYGDPKCDVPASGVMLINQSVREANRAAGYVSPEVPAATGSTGEKRPSDDGRSLQP